MVDQHNLKPYLKVHFIYLNLTVRRPSLFFNEIKNIFACLSSMYVLNTIFLWHFFSHTVLRKTWKWLPTPVLLSGKSLGWRSLVGCSPWGRTESDMTERLPFHFPQDPFLTLEWLHHIQQTAQKSKFF